MSRPEDGQGASGAAALRAALLRWYARHRRELPWRKDRDPYHVWVSEIMLQQTRVAAVLEHYREFLQAFPTLESLARAPEEQVLARWSGLGYYRRARMLHRAARQVVSDAGGVIPQAAEELRKLPGIGRYTAAAIASIAFGEPAAVVDGNVQRVLSRLDGEPHPVGCPRFRAAPFAALTWDPWKRAQQLLDPRHAGDWNQAMMELGATLCTPQNPQCMSCPLRRWCRAPGAETPRPRPARRRVESVRNLIERGGCVYLTRRAADAAKMAGMWELPECEGAPGPAPSGADLGDGAVAHKPTSKQVSSKELCVVRHSITDTDYEVRVMRLGLRALAAEQKRAGRWVKREKLRELPLTGLTRKILRKQGLHLAPE